MAFCFLCLVWTASGPAPLDSLPCERGLMAGARRFRFREEPGPGADGAVLEVRVPQVRAAAPTWKRPLVGALGVGNPAVLGFVH